MLTGYTSVGKMPLQELIHAAIRTYSTPDFQLNSRKNYPVLLNATILPACIFMQFPYRCDAAAHLYLAPVPGMR
jgi:hypothetical protein